VQVLLAAGDVEPIPKLMTKTPDAVQVTPDEWLKILAKITPQIGDTSAAPIKQRTKQTPILIQFTV